MMCRHDDCFTCPYEDCICDKVRKGDKKSRTKLSPEELKRHKKENNKKYYNKNRARISEWKRDYYKRKKAREGRS
jgi:hypothetical protein